MLPNLARVQVNHSLTTYHKQVACRCTMSEKAAWHNIEIMDDALTINVCFWTRASGKTKIHGRGFRAHEFWLSASPRPKTNVNGQRGVCYFHYIINERKKTVKSYENFPSERQGGPGTCIIADDARVLHAVKCAAHFVVCSSSVRYKIFFHLHCLRSQFKFSALLPGRTAPLKL